MTAGTSPAGPLRQAAPAGNAQLKATVPEGYAPVPSPRRDRSRRARLVAHASRSGCSAGAIRLLDALDAFRERGQPAHPRQVVLARWLGVCTRTVRRWTAEAEAAGLLDVYRAAAHHDPYSGRWRRRTNAYRCKFRATEKPKPPPRWGKPQATPSGHFCPHDLPTGRSRPRRPPPGAPPGDDARPLVGPPPPPPPPPAVKLTRARIAELLAAGGEQ